MNAISKGCIVMGVILILFGVLYHCGLRWHPFVRLPGDIKIETKTFTFYFPIVTCIILSILLSLIGTFFRFFR